MSYAQDFDTALVPDHSKFKTQPGFTRTLMTQLTERLGDLIYGFNSGETAMGFKKGLFIGLAADPSVPATNTINFYAKAIANTTEFYIQDSLNNIFQLSKAGFINGDKIKLSNNTAIVGVKSAGASTVDMIKVNASNNVELPNGSCLASNTAPVLNQDIANKEYVDVKVAALSKITAGTPCVQNPYTVSTITTQAHGLGATPTMVNVYLECLSADLGYSAGDRVVSFFNEHSNAEGCSIVFDATNVVIVSSAYIIYIFRKDTAAEGAITASKWKIVATPYLIS